MIFIMLGIILVLHKMVLKILDICLMKMKMMISKILAICLMKMKIMMKMKIKLHTKNLHLNQ